VPRRTDFLVALDAVLTAIDSHCGSGPGRHLRRRPLRRALVEHLLLQRPAPALAAFRRPWARLAATLDRLHRGTSRRSQLPAFAYLAARHGDSERRASSRLFGIPTEAEARAVRRLVAACGLGLPELAAEVPAAIRSVVDASFEEMVVQLDPHAVQDLLLASLEAFAVPRGRHRFTEAYGLCFGTVREAGVEPDRPAEADGLRRKRIVQVSRVATQVRARATGDSVTPNDESARVHLQVAEQVFEHLELLGDYHTHPWRSLEVCKRNRGWEMSDADHRHLSAWAQAQRAAGRQPRFALVLAVSRAGRVGRRFSRAAPNRVHLYVGQYSVFIAAYRLWLDGSSDDAVELRVPFTLD